MLAELGKISDVNFNKKLGKKKKKKAHSELKNSIAEIKNSLEGMNSPAN